MCEEVMPIVIDNGSYMCYAGFSGDDHPCSVFPSVVGYPKFKNSHLNDVYVGDEAMSKIGSLSFKSPIERGIIRDWDIMEKVLGYTFFNELKIDPVEHPVLITEPSFNPNVNREKLTSLIFETFNVPSFYLAQQGVLSLYACGRTTGIVLNSGEGITQIVPVFESFLIPYRSKRLNFAGIDLTEYLRGMLMERGYTYNTSADKELVRDIKQKLCYVALDFNAEMERELQCPSEFEKTYENPDGSVINIGNERFRCPEMLFKPHLGGSEYDGIEKSLYDTIMECNHEIQKGLFSNIILTGGTTMFKGFEDRLNMEIVKLAPPTTKVRVVAQPNRKYHTWEGGSILGSLSTFPQMAITKEEFDEVGEKIVHRKCSR
jgi:actin